MKIKALSVTLALVQLLSNGNSNINKNDTKEVVKPKSSIEQSISNNGSLVGDNLYKKSDNKKYQYYRLDEVTGEYKNISIFDKENISSKQYGASQLDFKGRFNHIIKESLIWDELQKYFPENSFDSKEEAVLFYEKYFGIINDFGCGYAAAANYVFRLYEGRENDFEKDFGYPMYTVNKDGFVDFNYEVFMLKFFNYSNIDKLHYKEVIMNYLLKDLYSAKLTAYINSDEYSKRLPDNFETWTDKEWDEWHEFDKRRNEKFQELYQKWLNARNVYYNFGVENDASFGYLYKYLIENCNSLKNINMSFKVYPDEFNVDEIVASSDFDLYKLNSNNKKYGVKKDVQYHYVYVSEITDDGKIVVSSWGNRYYFENDEDSYTSKIIIKTNKNK